jgi:hypothetical protein
MDGYIGASSPSGSSGGGGNVTIVSPLDGAGNVKVNVEASVLPTGAATSANQTNGNQISQIDGIFNAVAPTVTSGNQAEVQLDSTAAIYVNTEGRKATFRLCTFNQTALASAGNAFPYITLIGSATKLVKITKCRFSLWDTTGAAVPATILYSVATSFAGGTSSSLSVNPMDQNNPAATAAPTLYSVVPTTWSPPRNIDTFQYQLTTVSATTQPAPLPIDTLFGNGNGSQPVVLRGATQAFGLSISAIGTTPHVQFMLEWTEE